MLFAITVLEKFMKIVCNHCGADFDSTEVQSGKCPYCGSLVQDGGAQSEESSQGTNPDTFFEDITPEEAKPVYVPVAPEYHCSFPNDAKANKAVKDSFVCTIILLVLGIIRTLMSIINIPTIAEYKKWLTECVGTDLYAPLNGYINSVTAEVVLHVLIMAVAIVMLVFELKVRKVRFPLADDSAFADFKKVSYVAIAMTVIVVAYLIVEMLAVVYMTDYETIYAAMTGDSESTTGTTTGVIFGAIILIACTVGVLIESLKLSKEKK